MCTPDRITKAPNGDWHPLAPRHYSTSLLCPSLHSFLGWPLTLLCDYRPTPYGTLPSACSDHPSSGRTVPPICLMRWVIGHLLPSPSASHDIPIRGSGNLPSAYTLVNCCLQCPCGPSSYPLPCELYPPISPSTTTVGISSYGSESCRSDLQAAFPPLAGLMPKRISYRAEPDVPPPRAGVEWGLPTFFWRRR